MLPGMISIINSSASPTSLAEKAEPPASQTFYLNRDTNRIENKIDGLKAVEQTITMMLSTERYSHLIFSWEYGARLEKYIGKPYDYITGDIDREIKEALLTDNRITDVHSFSFNRNGNTMSVSFVAETIFGDTPMNVTVGI